MRLLEELEKLPRAQLWKSVGFNMQRLFLTFKRRLSLCRLYRCFNGILRARDFHMKHKGSIKKSAIGNLERLAKNRSSGLSPNWAASYKLAKATGYPAAA